MKNLLIITLFIGFQTNIFAQKREVYLGYNQVFFPKSVAEVKFNYFSYMKINNLIDTSATQHTRFQYNYLGTKKVVFKLKRSFSLGYRNLWNINQNWKIGTGFDIATLNYSFDTETNGSSTLIKTDTVDRNPFSSNPTVTCNFTNSYSDFGILDRIHDYTVLELKLPLEIRRVVISNRLEFYLGGFLASPLFTSEKYEYLDILHDNDANGNELCTYVKVDKIEKNVSEIRRTTFGMSAGYAILYRRFALTMGVEKRVNNFFQMKNQFDNSPLVSQPIALNFRLGYRF
jgi:hypothetical protein